jgi:ABC-type branched-subunit amino acid transport system permease subunit
MSRRQLVVIAVVLLGACALPFLVSDYRTFQFTLALVYAIALLGLNLLTGYNGQISLGHGAFYAIGAYTAAILMDQYGVPYWATLPVAAVVCLIAGFLFGLPALRLEGLYLFRRCSSTTTWRNGPAACRGSSSTSPIPRSACRSTPTSGCTTSRCRSRC